MTIQGLDQPSIHLFTPKMTHFNQIFPSMSKTKLLELNRKSTHSPYELLLVSIYYKPIYVYKHNATVSWSRQDVRGKVIIILTVNETSKETQSANENELDYTPINDIAVLTTIKRI